jgi:uncharacterized membrane protein YbhN (UPF0104 family)
MAALAGALMLGFAALLFVLLYEGNRFTPRPWLLRSYVVNEVAICVMLAFVSLGAALLIMRSDLSSPFALGGEAAVVAAGLALALGVQRLMRRRRLARPRPPATGLHA